VPVRAIKSTLVSILTIGLLVGSAVGVAAQEEEQAGEPSKSAKVAGTLRPGEDLVQEPTQTVVEGVLELRGFDITGGTFELDDPRLTGSFSVATNVDVHRVSEAISVRLQSHLLRIENEAGSWSGTGTSVFHGGLGLPEDEATLVFTVVLSGSDAYEGLSAYLVIEGPEVPFAVEGVIFAGEMPPFPGPPSAVGVAAQDEEYEPFGGEGRIEVPEGGYALTFPDGWLPIRTMVADASAMVETYGISQEFAESFEAMAAIGINLVAITSFSFGSQSCTVVSGPTDGRPLEEIVDQNLENVRLSVDLASEPERTMLVWPVGEVAQVLRTSRTPGGTDVIDHEWHLSDGITYYQLGCKGEERSDHWLSIAESFEFLPAE
jgi:hypothetical protein